MSETLDTSSVLADQLDRLLSQLVDRNLLNAAERGCSDSALANRVEQLGFASALVPESLGGAGLRWAELSGVFQTLGYHAAPYPLGESIIANWAIARAGLSVPEGQTVITAEILKANGDCTAVSGVCTVPVSSGSQQVVAIARAGKQQFLCLLRSAIGAETRLKTVGRDPRIHLAFDNVAPIASLPTDFGPYGLQTALAVLRSAQIAGALSRILALSLDYGNTRVQFGRPIGKFQAIQHMIAELAAEAAAAKAGVQLALRGLDAGKGFGPVAVAKIRTSMAAGKGAAIAHEVHGAIGVTEEHILHYFTRRLWQWRDDAGDEHQWSERLGQVALREGGSMFWPGLLSVSGE